MGRTVEWAASSPSTSPIFCSSRPFSGSSKDFFLLRARISASCISADLKLFLGLSPFSPKSLLVSVFVSYDSCNRATQTWFKTMQFVFLKFWRSERLAALKSGCQQGWVSRSSRGKPLSLPFLSFRGHVNPLAYDPYLHLQSTLLQSVVLSSHLLLPPLTLISL